MIIKKIELENIRSFEKESIEFSKGKTLLCGNIGSGKTSILLGIEFALFGLQPGQRGSSLIRNGKDYARVEMEFEIEKKQIIIERTLKRAKTVTQDYCSISIDGEKSELSVTELKTKVLELLAYPADLAKKQNLLYRFTVYTPQEEMKEIILENSETRVNTLRQLFGMDKYKTILENVSIIIGKLKEERKVREGITLGVEQDKVSVKKKEEELVEKRKKMFFLKKDFDKKYSIKERIESEMEEVRKKKEEKEKLLREQEKLKIIIESKENQIKENSLLKEKTLLQIKELETTQFSEEILQNKEKILERLKKEKEELQAHNLDIGTRMQALAIRNDENEHTKDKLKNIEVCPTCLQDVSSEYKQNVIKKLDSNSFKNISDIEFLAKEKRETIQKISKVEEEISKEEKIIQELKLIKIRLGDILDKRKKIEDIDKQNEETGKEIALLNSNISSLDSRIFDLKKFDIVYENKEKELQKAVRDERTSEILIAEIKKEIELFSLQIDELKDRIARIEEVRVKLNHYVELEDWLSKKFSPLVSFIEKSVMSRLKKEFLILFAGWFDMLVSDSFNITLSDDFSPIIEQQDYEIDYEYLSGGERTAIALAYRLALNQTINSLVSKIKTKNLVILDEPTDGFSENQLDKMRDVFDELNVEQLIIVSHEQKMEGFIDNIIRLKKENGVTRKE